MKSLRDYTPLDKLCMNVDQALRSVFGTTKNSARVNPAADVNPSLLTKEQRQHSASLMRVNHAGEVCAQALYHAQAFISQNQDIKSQMQQAAIEEGDHLTWCNERLVELGSHTSYLNPIWYAGSFMIGLTAGLISDEWNLGFLAETEAQVIKHLEHHLRVLPEADNKSYQILKVMHQDETNHRDEAVKAGAKKFPASLKTIMNLTSKIMVKTAYWI